METVEHLRSAIVGAVLSFQLAFYSGFHFLLNFGPSFFPGECHPFLCQSHSELQDPLSWDSCWGSPAQISSAFVPQSTWILWDVEWVCDLGEFGNLAHLRRSDRPARLWNVVVTKPLPSPSLCWKFLSLEAFSGLFECHNFQEHQAELFQGWISSGVPWDSDVHLIKNFSWSISHARRRGTDTHFQPVFAATTDSSQTDVFWKAEHLLMSLRAAFSFLVLLLSVFHPQVLETVRNIIADERVKIDVVEAFDPLPISPWDEQTFAVHIFQRTILDTFPDVDSVVPGDSRHMIIIVSSSAFPSPSTPCFHLLCAPPPQLLTAGNSWFFLFLFHSLFML